MSWVIISPEQEYDLRFDPNFQPAERYKEMKPVPGEVGRLVSSDGATVLHRFITVREVFGCRVIVTEDLRKAVGAYATGKPQGAPKLFRLVEQPLGLCPFPLTVVALACMPCPQEPNG